MANETKSSSGPIVPPVSQPLNPPPRVTMIATPSISPGAPPGSDKPHATLHILQRDGSVIERDLTRVETRLGKGPENDIVLTDAAVSTQHASIRFNGKTHTLTDVGSRNGTFVNEAKVNEPRELHHGDVIKMGHCTLTFRLAEVIQTVAVNRTEILGAGAPPPPPAPPTPTAPPPLTEESLAKAVINSKLVAPQEIERVRTRDAHGRRLYRALVEERLATELGLRDLMSRTFNIQPVDLRTAEVDLGAAQALHPKFLREHLFCPLAGQSDSLLLAVADPTDPALEEVKRKTPRSIALRLATASEIAQQLDKQFIPRLIGILASGEKVETVLNQAEIAIGKASHNRLVLSDPTVSNTHAAVLVRDGGFSIVDLGSSNGTFVNGKQLAGDAVTLQHGDRIQLGTVLLTFRNPAETTESKTARLSPEALEEFRRRAGLGGPAVSGTTVPHRGAVTATPVNPVSTPASGSLSDEEKAEKKRRKKEKEKEKNSWLSANSLSRIVAQVLGALIALMGPLVLYWLGVFGGGKTSGDNPPPPPTTGGSVRLAQTKWTPFNTGLLGFGRKPEASGVIAVPGSSGLLIVDDGRKNEILWMPLNEKGEQAGELKPVPLNVSFKDAEAITYGNSYFYVITSQTDPALAESNTLMRFAFDPQTQTIRGAQAEIINDLRSFLLNNVPEIKARGEAPGLQGGLNIEGMAFDPNNERLLLGLRSPFVGNQAVLVPLKLINPLMPLSLNNIKVDTPSVITLSLDGQGVRDITYDTHSKNFLVISGAPETQKKVDFGLWEWSGKATDQPRKIDNLDENYKPEGITGVGVNGQNFVLVVGDAGSYLKLEYR